MHALSSQPFQPYEIIPGDPACGLLLLCDHATNALPAEYGTLGLPQSQLDRHIGWDIGAADVTKRLARRFRAPALLTRFSRLLIDPNRGPDDPTLVMRLSDGALVPGNAYADEEEIARRVEAFHRPYHAAIARQVDAMLAAGVAPMIVSIHSFTPIWRGVPRPWHIGFCWDKDRRLSQAMIDALSAADPRLVVGDNEPYDGFLEGDTLFTHGTRRGLAHTLVELRQDLVGTDAGAAEWSDRLAAAIEPLLADPALHRVEHHGSRADASVAP